MKILYLLFALNEIFTTKINLINHNNQDINLIKPLDIILFSLPMILRNEDKCEYDSDCPSVMKCCQIGNHKYCCTPNNNIKLKYAYIKNYIKND